MSTGVEELARVIVARRLHLGWTQRDLIERSAVSKNVIQAMEGAEERSYRPMNKKAVEDILGWEQGSIDAVLTRSGPPRVVGQASVSEQTGDIDELTASYAELGAYADRLSQQANNPEVGALWYAGVLRRRRAAEVSRDQDDTGNRHAM